MEFVDVTDSKGFVRFNENNAADGTYTSVIMEVIPPTGFEWDLATPASNSFVKPIP